MPLLCLMRLQRTSPHFCSLQEKALSHHGNKDIHFDSERQFALASLVSSPPCRRPFVVRSC